MRTAQVPFSGYSVPGLLALRDWPVLFHYKETRSVWRVRATTSHQHQRCTRCISWSSTLILSCLISIAFASSALLFLKRRRWLSGFIRTSCILQVWSLKIEQEEEKNKALAEALQTLATEHQELKSCFNKSGRFSTLETLTEDDFYDAVSGQQVCLFHDPDHQLPTIYLFNHIKAHEILYYICIFLCIFLEAFFPSAQASA